MIDEYQKKEGIIVRISKDKVNIYFPEILNFAKGSEIIEVEEFYYFYFETVTEQFRDLVEYLDRQISNGAIDGVEAISKTGFWLNGKAFSVFYDGVVGVCERILLCSFRNTCGGICKHNLNTRLYDLSKDWRTEKLYNSLEGFKDWMKVIIQEGEVKDYAENNYLFNALLELAEDEIYLLSKDQQYLEISKEHLEFYTQVSLTIEYKYCTIISDEKIRSVISTFPDKIFIHENVKKLVNFNEVMGQVYDNW